VRHRHELEQCADGAMPPRLMDDLAPARPNIATCATQLSAEMHADTAGRTAAARWIVCWDLVGEKLVQVVGQLARTSGVEELAI